MSPQFTRGTCPHCGSNVEMNPTGEGFLSYIPEDHEVAGKRCPASGQVYLAGQDTVINPFQFHRLTRLLKETFGEGPVEVDMRLIKELLDKVLSEPTSPPEPDPTEIPDGFFPAALVEGAGDADPDEEDQVARVLTVRKLEGLDVGFVLGPYDPKATAAAVREAGAAMFQAYLKAGAYLYRAKLKMGTRSFWIWFQEQGFPFGRRWAEKSISTVRQIMADGELRKIAKRMSSIKCFEVVAKRLTEPQGRQEFQRQGTVYGHSPEELEAGGTRAADALAKETADAEQLEMLPYEEVRKQRDGAMRELADLKAEAEAKARALDAVQLRLTKLENPDLNAAELTTEFLAMLREQRFTALDALTRLNPHRRRDWKEALGQRAVLELYASLLAIQKIATANLREVEFIWGSAFPELLQDDDGQPRTPTTRQGLRIIRREAQETWEAASAIQDGEGVDVVDAYGVIQSEGL